MATENRSVKLRFEAWHDILKYRSSNIPLSVITMNHAKAEDSYHD